jgi:AcrR family transcriptional regulator
MSPRTSRPDLRQRKAEEILHAAAAVFAELGYRRTRMIDVAERAGVGKGTIYEYFRTKEELFLAIFEGYVENAMVQAEDAAGHSTDPVSALRAFAESTFAELRRMLALYPLTLEFWAAAAGSEFADRVSTEFRSLYRRYGDEVAAMIRAGVEAGYFAADVPVDHVARVLVGAIDGIYLQAWFDDEFAAEEAGAAFVEIVLRGLAAPNPPTPSEES